MHCLHFRYAALLQRYPVSRPNSLHRASLLLTVQASQQDGDITTENVTIAVVGKDQPFTMLEGDSLAPFVAQLENDGVPGAAADGDDGGDGAAPMES